MNKIETEDTDIKQKAIEWAENQMEQVREVELQQIKYFEKTGEQPRPVKACFLFQRDAFFNGERAALQMVLHEINRMAVERDPFPIMGLIKFIGKQLSIK